MNIYLISFDLQVGDWKMINHFLSTLGEVVPAHKHASLLASDIESEDEIHQAMREYYEHKDQWVITKLNENYSGYSNVTESVRNFLRKHRFN